MKDEPVMRLDVIPNFTEDAMVTEMVDRPKMLFTAFDKLRNILDNSNELQEIQVSRNQIILMCYNIVEFDKFEALLALVGNNPTDISVLDNTIYISYRNIDEWPKPLNKDIEALKEAIDLVADTVCQCPSLSLVVAENFIKIYIDKPNVKIQDIAKLDRLYGEEGILQTGEQRSYMLYIRE